MARRPSLEAKLCHLQICELNKSFFFLIYPASETRLRYSHKTLLKREDRRL
jgi:hypothetical protein